MITERGYKSKPTKANASKFKINHNPINYAARVKDKSTYTVNMRKAYGDDKDNEYQYFDLYRSRMSQTYPRLESTVHKKFPGVTIKPLVTLRIMETAVIPGILIKKFKNQEQILNEFLDDAAEIKRKQEEAHRKREILTDQDEFLLEDNSQRVILTGNVSDIFRYSFTGECVCIHAQLQPDGTLEVIDIARPDIGMMIPTTNRLCKQAFNTALISDLRFGAATQPTALKLELLSSFLRDLVGEENEQSNGLNHVTISGILTKEIQPTTDNLGRIHAKKFSEAVHSADSFLSQISPFVETCVIPGRGEIAQSTLPSEPFHPVMFKKASGGKLISVSAPWRYQIDEFKSIHLPEIIFQQMLGYSDFTSILEIMKHLIKISHWTPLSPDIIPCIPFQDRDKFVIDEIPDIIWTVGEKFCQETIDLEGHQVLLLVVPSFATTSEFVILTAKENGKPEAYTVLLDCEY